MQTFWKQNYAYEDQIRERARRYYEGFDGERSWHALTADEQFPWCLAAERTLTAQRIERDRMRVFDKQWYRG